jgi:hypothetical protein
MSFEFLKEIVAAESVAAGEVNLAERLLSTAR